MEHSNIVTIFSPFFIILISFWGVPHFHSHQLSFLCKGVGEPHLVTILSHFIDDDLLVKYTNIKYKIVYFVIYIAQNLFFI